MILRTILIMILGFATSSLHSETYQEHAHSRIALISPAESLAKGTTVSFGLHVKLDPGWHVYWRNSGDSGAPPLVHLKAPGGVSLGPIAYPVPKRLLYPPLVTFGYEGEALYALPVRVGESVQRGEGELTFDVELLVCQVDCIPVFAEFSQKVSFGSEGVSESTGAFRNLADRFVWPRKRAIETTYRWEGEALLAMTLPGVTGVREFFPLAHPNLKNHPVTFVEDEGVSSIILHRKDRVDGPVSGLVVQDDGAVWVTAKPVGEASLAWLTYAWLAFLGGLLLNLMPCVFPVIGIKVLALLKQAELSRMGVRRHTLAFTSGVLLSFVGFGVVLGLLREWGQSLGWGFQLQSPIFVGVLVLVFLLLALTFWGGLEWRFLPAFRPSQKVGLSQEFFNGVLAVVVASPCTAPFMGAALGYALTQPLFGIVIIFSALGVGFAAPFLVFTFFPGLLGHLPRPGPWLISLRKALAVPLLLTAVWLGTVLYGLLLPSQGRGGDHWQPYRGETLAELTEYDGPLLLNFTASWCITCQVNDLSSLSDPRVLAMAKERGMRLIKVDWTSHDPKIGDMISSFGRASIPLYVYYPHRGAEPELLPELLTPGMLLERFRAE